MGGGGGHDAAADERNEVRSSDVPPPDLRHVEELIVDREPVLAALRALTDALADADPGEGGLGGLGGAPPDLVEHVGDPMDPAGARKVTQDARSPRPRESPELD